MSSLNCFKLALIQLKICTEKHINLERASNLISKAGREGADIICLPECFNSPYGVQYFTKYAEKIPGMTSKALGKAAEESKAFLIGGSYPEFDGSRYYNTSCCFNRSGDLVSKYRKTHLFDIDIPGKITFHESKVLTAGDNLTIFYTEFCKIGLGICYDIRFPEVAAKYSTMGCKLLVYPGAFNMTTGPAHWELLQRARALDNQVYVATVSPARDPDASYVAYGHSMVTDPYGKVIASASADEDIIYADIDLDYTNEVRSQIPVLSQRRHDIYNDDSSFGC